MKKSNFTKTQIVSILKQADAWRCVVRMSSVAVSCGGEVVLMARPFGLGVDHDLFLRVELNAPIDVIGLRI